jgi:acyl dehydratase
MQQKPRSSSEKLRLEDLRIGETVAFGRKHLTRDEIVAFAGAYDPQLIHLDEEVAKKSIVAGLCASGFHSCAILMRMLVDDVLAHTTSLGSPGMDEVKWLKPVRPGDVLTGRYTCTDKRADIAARCRTGQSHVRDAESTRAGRHDLAIQPVARNPPPRAGHRPNQSTVQRTGSAQKLVAKRGSSGAVAER